MQSNESIVSIHGDVGGLGALMIQFMVQLYHTGG